jgi:murein DD-endopeptidase MepM/ murein hydrolase activator NlpD
LVRNNKYILDPASLQYKQVKLHWKVKLFRFTLWFAGSIVVALLYGFVFNSTFGSPKQRKLEQQIENLKLQYSLLGRELDNSVATLKNFRLSDDRLYRPILDMDTLPDSYRKAGFGGVDRFTQLAGYTNSDLLINFRTRIEEIKSRAKIQNESFKSIEEKSNEWRREMDHMPLISPVDVKYRLGDGFKFRAVHPILGTPRMHYGQDFEVPYGTNVYATGDGQVIESGWNSGGFGNYVVIDHGYGLETIYGHLSVIKVTSGMNVKRGDLLGLSGSSGLSSGPHLHYQIEKFGQHVNPINFFHNDLTEEEYNEMIQAMESKSNFR